MSAAFTHIALHVRDVDACVEFYKRFCGLETLHERSHDAARVVWLGESRRKKEFIIVLVPGGSSREQALGDFSHLGFALESRAAVDAVAARAAEAGRLVWAPREEPYPVGYYCGARDPNGTIVEFSYGQPLGPGAPPDARL
jgi:catechol 2,3-dioxygenase-like lactoylglutathione lyase family enzyme